MCSNTIFLSLLNLREDVLFKVASGVMHGYQFSCLAVVQSLGTSNSA